MKPVHPEFVPDASLSREAMEQLQREIAAAAVFDDDPARDFDSNLLVAGVDQAFTDEMATSGVVLVRDGEVVERVAASRPLPIPYIPGLLSFREGHSILAAFEQLDREPDVALFDGSGRIHYREAGLATHIGVTLDLPAIGVAKSLLCGHPTDSLDDPLDEGRRVPIVANQDVTAPDDTVIGYAFQSRQYDSGNRHINPLYVSPGHRIGPETAVDIVDGQCSGFKLPEPVRLADQYVGELTR